MSVQRWSRPLKADSLSIGSDTVNQFQGTSGKHLDWIRVIRFYIFLYFEAPNCSKIILFSNAMHSLWTLWCAHCYWLIKQVFPKNYINNFLSTCARTRARVKPIFCERSYWIWPKFWWKKLYGILRWCFWPQIDAPHTITPQIALSPRFSVCMLYLLTWVVHLVWWAERSNLEWNITLQAWASIQMISNPWKSKQLVQWSFSSSSLPLSTSFMQEQNRCSSKLASAASVVSH